jgi:elongation factor P
MLAKEIKPGAVVVHNESPVMIESVSVQSPSARGAATLYKFRGRNLVTKQKTDITLKGTDSLPEADFGKRPVKLMYQDAEQMHLLDQESFNQYSIPLEQVEYEAQFITEELEGAFALIYNDECVGVHLPTAVDLTIAECDPAIRGNSATARTKPLKLETGLVVHGPEYLSQGERVRVDTRTGEYLSRA